MSFNSISEIRDFFKLVSDDPSKIKKELKKSLKALHPDKNEGEFKSEADENLYLQITSALDYLEATNLNTSLIVNTEVLGLTKILQSIVHQQNKEIFEEQKLKKSAVLSTELQNSITTFHKQNSTPKITSLILTAVITAIWVFPNVVKDHPLLSFLNTYNKEFTIFWIAGLIATGIFWLKIKSLEKIDEDLKRSYKLESTQNIIFSFFINWMSSTNRNSIINDEKEIFTFSKDDLVTFLTTRFPYLKKELEGKEYLKSYEMRPIIERTEFSIINAERKSNGLLNNIFLKPGELDVEISELICDLIIDRLRKKYLKNHIKKD
ncbi:hypothetical protein [Dyadobacter diqingensis]|uniref:hypothetical protein n=1 Tax=Dyadobacter diqingensis TaxID=2938121 RepID=UPI0020C1997D|nr:hypothetical protein [Dyadobacter diqingensis]